MRKSHKLLAVLSLAALVLLGGGGLFAQNHTCQGTVKDAQGEPVIAASVLIRGATLSTGVITDMDGRFLQPNAKKGDVLVISCVGYETAEVPWNGEDIFVVLNDDSTLLQETVVTAYGGRQLRTKVTNSISSVSSETIASGMHNQAASSLAGAVSGLRVSQTSGNPNSAPTIVLRGGTGLDGSGSPLVIVDGAYRSMTDVNPNDIESIEVLKDAGATAIYGARAADGVIIVTTKRGQEGTSSINLRAKASLNFMKFPYEYLESEDYLYWMRTAQYRTSWVSNASLSGVQPYGTGNYYFDGAGNVANGNYDAKALWGVFFWTPEVDFLLNSPDWGKMTDPVTGNPLVFWRGAKVEDVNIKTPSLSQDYTVDFSGGNAKGGYYASLGYNNTEGNAVDNVYDRLTFTFNGDYKLRPWLTSNSSFNYSHMKWVPIKNGNGEYYYFTRALSVPPTMRIFNAYNEFNPSARSSVSDGAVGLYNQARQTDYNRDRFTISQSFTFTLTPWLSAKVFGSWFIEDLWQEAFTRDYRLGPYSSATSTGMSTTRASSNSYSRNLNQTYNAVLNFNKTFSSLHNVSAMLGWEFLDYNSKGFSASGRNAPTDEFQDLALTEVGDTRSIDSSHSRQRVMSGFGKADYDYDGKYLFSAVFRYDGYSRLARENRWHLFPGFSAGWVLSKEPFMRPLRSVISFAKIRTSYGANGVLSSSIGNYTVQGNYQSYGNYKGSGSTLLYTLPNPALRWEQSWTYEAGLDISFFDNRLNINSSFYNRHTSDKIASITIPSHTGYSSFLSNNGEIKNTGFELDLTARVVKTADWNITAKFNASYNVNKIVKLPNNGNENNRQGGMQVYVPGSYNPVTGESEMIWVGGYQEGQRPGDIYGFQALGLYRSEDEIPGFLVDTSTGGTFSSPNKPLYGPVIWETLTDAERANGLLIEPGDVRWKDVNGDGLIDDRDKVYLGNSVPKWVGGFNLNAAWKGLSLNARFDYALDYKISDINTAWALGCMQGTFNTMKLVEQTFNPETGEGNYPTYVYADQNGKRNYARTYHSMFVYEGSYLAFRELTLGYDLPKRLLSPAHLNKVNVYVSGQNLGYLSEAARYLGSPEYESASNYNSWGTYPLPVTLIFGVNVSF